VYNIDIAILVRHLTIGGAQKVAINLSKSFAEKGLKVDLITIWKRGELINKVHPKVRLVDLDVPSSFYPYRLCYLIKFLLQKQLTSFDLDYLIKLNSVIIKIMFKINKKVDIYPFWLNIISLKMADYIRVNKPCVILAIDTIPNIIALKAKQFVHIPISIFLNEQTTPSIGFNLDPRKQLIKYWIQKLYPQSNSIIAVSQGVAEDLIYNYRIPKEKIKVIHNPIVNKEIFDIALEDVNHPWFKTKQSPVILGIGRLARAKDFPTLLRAFALVRRFRPVRLVILGEGEERANLERLAIELGIQNDVSMPGFVDNPFAFMAKASVFVLSSAWEGLPTVLVEALACGCPVVATDCRSGPREILDNGRYGRLVPVGDHEALAKAILETLDNPDFPATREERIQRALEFSLDAAVEKYLQVLLPERFANL
jgi:glycosyltransferase involved in cell wall biosynthesis